MVRRNEFSFQHTDIREIDPAELVDRKDIHINKKLPRDKRMADFMRQTRNHPDCIIIDGVIVLSRFADTETTIEDRISAAIRNA